MAHTRLFPLSALAFAATALFAGAPAFGQNTLPPVTVIGRSLTSSAGVSGFSEVPLHASPFQAQVLSIDQLNDSGVHTLAGITRFDASLSDAYNSEGYWSNFIVRGVAIHPRANYRRDGLPINAETSLPLANKERIEVLKGTSGIQAGISAPGGLVNLVVKRPDGNFTTAALGWTARNSWGAGVDLSRRFGETEAFGLRLNLQHDQLDPQTRDLKGRASLAAIAGEWRIAPGTFVEAEIEASRRSQPSAPAMSLLGPRVPSATAFDPRTNFNNQPWSTPVVLEGDTASLRLRHTFAADWEGHAHLGLQRLRSDDRLAFPYGCSAEDSYDRYCSDGSFDLYDFRSDDEQRDTDSLDIGTRGKFTTGDLSHTASAGVLFTRFKARFQRQAYNDVGTGTIDGATVTSADPALTDENTHRDERSTELYLRDNIALGTHTTAWLGLRHSRIGRDSVRTDGSRPTDDTRQFTTPWLAMSHELAPGTIAYASWGQGIETDMTPNRERYTNGGEGTTLRTRQAELGLKGHGKTLDWSATLFAITRPYMHESGPDCGSDTPGNTCTRHVDGQQRHSGLETNIEWRQLPGALAVQASAMLLRARLQDVATNPSLNGKRPANVPERSLRLNLRHDSPFVPGLRVTGGMVYEGPRMVLPDNSASIPGWTRFDAALRYEHKLPGASQGSWVWRAGVDNLTNKRAWKESPHQFGHAYLYPLSPRTFRISVEANL